MPSHEYTAQQALQVIMQKLERNPELAKIVQAAVDAGKDLQAAEPKGKNKPHEYRKTVPYTYEEAIRVALTALEAYFIAQPLFRNSCADNLAQTVIGMPRSSDFKIEAGQKFDLEPKSFGTSKAVQIELRTETQLLPETLALQKSGEVHQLERVSSSEIDIERENMARLRRLLDFDE